MTTKQINHLLELISEAVSGDDPWMDKRDAVLAQCNDDMKVALEEFVGWFTD